MSQQEFEPRGHQSDDEIYQPQYPYSWSDRIQEEGLPRDKLSNDYSNQSNYQSGQAPSWAQPQPRRRNGPYVFAAIVALAVLITLGMGALGIIGVVLGSLAHVLGVILGAIFALLIFVFLMVFLVLALVGRAIGRAVGQRPSWMDYRRPPRRFQRTYRWVERRAARRSWRDRWY